MATSDLGKDFTSTCMGIEERLISLLKTYAIFSEAEIKQLRETGRQLREKQILISFVGRLNVGKSTLLNALLGVKLLPMKMEAETSIRVHIHHDPKAPSDQHPKLIWNQEEVVGVLEIYEKLEILNQGVRVGAQGHDVCTLKTNVSLLANTPQNWQVVLVDTPGRGDFNGRVAVAADGAVKSSSAYMLITTYGQLQLDENVNFIRFLHEYDQGALETRRLIIVVTQFDLRFLPTGINEEITVEKVHRRVQQLVSKACPDVTLSVDDVLPLSGLWAFNARMLMSHPDGPEHDIYRRNVVWCLTQNQSLPSGQHESRSSCFLGKTDDELAKQLLDVSGFARLEARIHNLTESCIKVWVSKVKGDYERYLKQAREKLTEQSESELEQQKEQEEECSRLRECLGDIEEERRDLEDIMKVGLYADLRRMYPPDHEEVRETLEQGRQMVLDGIKDFNKQCIKKVRDGRVKYGQDEFEEDAKAFLEKMSNGLELISSHANWFKTLNNVLTVRTTEMGTSIQRMKGKVEELCTIPRQNISDEEIPIQASERIEPFIAPRLKLMGSLRFPILMSVLRSLFDPDEPASYMSYRFWNKDQRATMDQLEGQLIKGCDEYFDEIKQHVLKYFHDQYCLETRCLLNIFDGESKAKIEGGRKWLQELTKSIESTDCHIKELQHLCEDLKTLDSNLHTAADD